MNLKVAFAVVGATAVTITALPQAAEAASLKWLLNGTLSDNNTAVNGSFVYDAATNAYSDISIKGKFGTYTGTPDPGFSANGFQVGLGGPTRILEIAFQDSLVGKTVGNTVQLKNLFPGPISYESQGVPTFTNPNTFGFASGSVTAVPTPALLPGLVGLGVAALRRKQDDETAEESA